MVASSLQELQLGSERSSLKKHKRSRVLVSVCMPGCVLWLSVLSHLRGINWRWGVSTSQQAVLHCNYSVSISEKLQKNSVCNEDRTSRSPSSDYSGGVCLIEVWMSNPNGSSLNCGCLKSSGVRDLTVGVWERASCLYMQRELVHNRRLHNDNHSVVSF